MKFSCLLVCLTASFSCLIMAGAQDERAIQHAREHVKAIELVKKWEPLKTFPDELRNQLSVELDAPVFTAEDHAKALKAIPKQFLGDWTLGQTIQVGEWWVTPVGKGLTPGQAPWIHVFAVKKGGKLLYKNSRW